MGEYYKIAFYKDEFIRDIGGKIESKLSELETQTIQFLAYQGEKFHNEFPYYPQLEAAYVYLPVVKEIIKDPRGTVIKYADVYLEKGIEQIKDVAGNAVNNVEGILLDIRKENIDPVTQKFKGYVEGEVNNIFNNVAEKLAGVVKPEMAIKAISLYENAYGTYQQCAEVIDTAKNIKQITAAEIQNFKNNIFKEAKLLGAIELKKILSDKLRLDNLPISEFKEIYDTVNGLRTIEKIQVRYNWTGGSEIFDEKDFGIVHFYNRNFSSADKTNIVLNFFQEINIRNASKSFYESKTSLNNFGIGIKIGAPIITLYFNNITFKSATIQKPEVDVTISKVEFSGLLELVKQLQNSLGTFGKGLSFGIFGDKILVSYQFVVPAISCGAFNLMNLSFGFEFLLYFRNKPLTFNFSLSERNNPALLSIGIFGGRFFGKLGVSSKGLEQIEILIEFGGYLGVNLGVAKGCVYLFAGIYYKKTKDCAEIDGYIVCGGVLNVLGIVSLSLTFYMGVKSGCGGTGELRGYAQVRVSIRITRFFKISRTIGMEKRLSNSGINKYGFIDETSENKDIQIVPDESLLFLSIEDRNFVQDYVNAFK